MKFKFNKVKIIVATVSLVLFAIFFYVGYRIGLQQARETFPEPEEIWSKEEGPRVEAGISSDIVRLPDGTWRMYYVVKEGIVSAVSQDGKLWNRDEGIRIAAEFHSKTEARVGSPTIISLKDGGYRMIYEASNENQTTFILKSATSSDGLSWTKEKGTRLEDTNRFDQDIAAAPDAVKTKTGEWLLYYCDGDTIKLAVSGDEGLDWSKKSLDGLPNASLDPTVIIMPDGVYRMYFAKSESDERLLKAKILSARSSDGREWTVEQGTRVVADKKANMVVDPDVIMVSLGKMRLYYTQLDKGIINGTGSKAPVMSIRSATLELR